MAWSGSDPSGARASKGEVGGAGMKLKALLLEVK